jgi:putative DNA primase/helicase
MVSAWWEDDFPLSNVGIRTGQEPGLVVLDVDPHHGGDESIRQLEAQYGPLPETPTVSTGGGGQHFYFQHPGFRVPNRSSALGAGLDIRGDGGSVVAPPSLHVSGKPYQWESERTPCAVSVAPLPVWVLALLREPSRLSSGGSAGSHGSWGIGADGLIPEGQRNETLFRIACQLYRAGLPHAMVLEDLLEWNMEKCASPLPEHEVQQIVRSAARYVPDTGTTGEPCTELGNSRRFIARHGRNLRYVPQWKKWLIWNDTCWAVDDKNEVTTRAKETLRNLYGELTGIEDAEKRQTLLVTLPGQSLTTKSQGC